MQKFTDEQVEELREILEVEFNKPVSPEEACMAAHNLYELYDTLSDIHKKLEE